MISLQFEEDCAQDLARSARKAMIRNCVTNENIKTVILLVYWIISLPDLISVFEYIHTN